jgi:putative membrane protein
MRCSVEADSGGVMTNNGRGSSEPAGIVRDHLANERTLLAWTRTALAAAALGFVVAKIRFTTGPAFELTAPQHAISRVAGAAFVFFAFAMETLGIWRYLDLRRRLRGGPFRPLGWAMMALNLIIAGGILLLFVYVIVTWSPGQ